MVTLGEATIRVRGDGTLLPGDLDRAAEQAGERSADRALTYHQRRWRKMAPLVLTAGSLGLGAVGGALLAANAAVFAGMAIAAVASTERVKSAYADLGQDIIAGAQEDAAVMVPALERIATQLGDTYSDLRPQLRDAFEASTPLLERFVDAADRAARTALPAMVRAVDEADPVVDGLNDALQSITEGFAGMVDNITDDAPEMGQVLSIVGDVVGDVLPLLGELIGISAELGTIVLPPLAAAIGAVAAAADWLAPLLVVIGPALLGMKVGKMLTGPLGSLSGLFTSLAQNAAAATYGLGDFSGRAVGRASDAAGRMANQMSRASETVGKMGAALPLLGIGLALVSSDMEKNENLTRQWADGMMEGGKAAADALAAAEAERDKYGTGWGDQLSYELDVWAGFAPNVDEARKAVEEYEASLSPMELAQYNVTKAQNDYNYAVDEFGNRSPQAREALAAQEQATAALEREQRRLQFATEGTTEAIVNQAQQILAAADSDLAYRLALDDTKVAMEEYADVVKEFGPTSEEAASNALNLEETVLAQANAFATARADALGLEDGLERDGVMAAAALEELERLRNEMGVNFPAALQGTIEKLQGVEGGLVSTEQQAALAKLMAENLGIAVNQIPGNKTVWIETPTKEQEDALARLGYVVRTMPDGRSYVTVAGVREAENDLTYLSRGREVTLRVVARDANGNRGFKVNGGVVWEAEGGIVQARHFADGGFMDGSYAQIVQPNTWRVIGDRVTDDEAFIPINDDPRSVGIWEEAGRRMGQLGGREGARLDLTWAPVIQSSPAASPEQIAAAAGQHFVRDTRLGLSGRFTGIDVLEAAS